LWLWLYPWLKLMLVLAQSVFPGIVPHAEKPQPGNDEAHSSANARARPARKGTIVALTKGLTIYNKCGTLEYSQNSCQKKSACVSEHLVLGRAAKGK
jgi:hypothetical protein